MNPVCDNAYIHKQAMLAGIAEASKRIAVLEMARGAATDPHDISRIAHEIDSYVLARGILKMRIQCPSISIVGALIAMPPPKPEEL